MGYRLGAHWDTTLFPRRHAVVWILISCGRNFHASANELNDRRQQMYLDAVYLALVFLRRAFPRSGKSNEPVAFINPDKSFSQRALRFPAKLKKCKAVNAAYLARGQQQSEAQSSTTGE